MSNVDRAAKVIDQWTQEGYELNSAVGSPHAIAERLAKAGLLAPDLPEPSYTVTECEEEKPVWEPCGPGYAVTRYKEPITGRYLIGVYDSPYAVESQEAHAYALALLAAVNYREEA